MKEKFLLVYKTSITPFFPICLVARSYTGTFRGLIKSKIRPTECIAVIKDGVVNWFFPERMKDVAGRMFLEIFSSSSNIKIIKSKEKLLSKELLKEIKNPITDIFDGKKLNKTGIKKLKKIFELYSEYGKFIDTPGFLFQVYIGDIIQQEFFHRLDFPEKNKEEMVGYLFSSHKKTNFEKFLFLLNENLYNPNAQKKIAQKFYWLLHDYVGEIIDFIYVSNRAKYYRGKGSELEKNINAAHERIKTINEIKNHLPKDLLRKINIISEILYLYNERKKEVLNRVNIFIRRIFEYKFPRISTEELRKIYQFSPEEILIILSGGTKKIKLRNIGWVYLLKNGKILNGSSRYFSLLKRDIKEKLILKGLPASKGKTRGIVDIVLNISQIYKFKKGNILVAPFTSANYLPIMNNAKAVLTETGGITSHAAIVSRELNKPCIVGIKGILSCLKDGDLVEVDANKGIVRILK